MIGRDADLGSLTCALSPDPSATMSKSPIPTFANASQINTLIKIYSNLGRIITITIICIHPVVQQYDPRSGLAHRQRGMVAVYCTL